MHPPAQPLAHRAVLQRRDPQRGNQIPAAQLGQHARVDLVGLAGQRRDVADLARVRDLHLPPRRREAIADPHRAAHHLHARPHVRAKREHELDQPVLVGRHHSFTSDRAALAARTPRRTPIRPIDPEILHPRASLHGLSYTPMLSLSGRPSS
jgi:hypothetical protein